MADFSRCLLLEKWFPSVPLALLLFTWWRIGIRWLNSWVDFRRWTQDEKEAIFIEQVSCVSVDFCDHARRMFCTKFNRMLPFSASRRLFSPKLSMCNLFFYYPIIKHEMVARWHCSFVLFHAMHSVTSWRMVVPSKEGIEPKKCSIINLHESFIE